ncbi:MAG: InlB B-repeat-containing protein, partial [Bacilli bacterium]|nr:InlB B-repeat-containing protein [Bacilli bacterium]
MKLFKKIAIAAIGVVMALGVGIGVSVHNDVWPAKAEDEAIINFGNNGTTINKASVKGNDSNNVEWTITTTGTDSFTPNSTFCQIGSAKNAASSIEFVATLPVASNITSFSAKFGGFSGTAGLVTLSVDNVSVGSGNLNGTSDVEIESTSSATGSTLKVTVTSIAKGVIAYYISYTTVAEAVEYTVSFDAGEGSGTMTNQTINTSSYVLPECSFTAPTGKEFDCWTIGGVGQGTHYLPGESISVTSDITVYANYKNCLADVVFDFSQIDGFKDWGTTYKKHVVEYDKAVVTFTSANHSTSTITDVPVTRGEDVYISTVNRPNLKISSLKWDFRQWGSKKQTITISYSTDGGKNYVEAASESNSFSVEISSLPANVDTVRASFSSQSNQIGIASIMVNFSGEFVSYAYNVTYDANGATSGDVPVDDTNYNSGSEVTVLGNVGNLDKAGYSFAGWNTSPDGSGTSYSAGQTFNITDNIVLYAQWSLNTYSYKHAGTESDPFDVEDAYMKALETGATATSDYYYIQGTITRFYQNPIYNGITSPYIGDGEFEFEGYRLKDGRNGVNSPIDFLNTETDLEVGAIITIYGKIKMYNGTTAETEEGGCVAAIQRTSTRIVSSIEISDSMSKTAYLVGDAWDYSGFKVIATYSDNTTADVTQFVTWTSNPELAYDSSITSINITVSYRYADITKTAQCTQNVIVSEILDHYTFDLTIDQTVVHTDDKLSWESPYVSINLNKNESSNNATHYYPGTSGRNYTSTRFYKNQLVTIIPMDGYKIDR